jgi:hypothetical protein
MKSVEQVEEFERLEQQLHSMLTEISELSKKKANDGVNKFKLKLINVILAELNEIIGTDKPFEDFEKFDENDLPTNSDVVVMLSQYAAAVNRFRAQNTQYTNTHHEWRWIINKKLSDMHASDPIHLKYRGR